VCYSVFSHSDTDCISMIREMFLHNKQYFSPADIVEGGFQMVFSPPKGGISLRYVRGCARELYIMVLSRFLFDFEVSYMVFIRNKLDTDAWKEITEFISNSEIFKESKVKEKFELMAKLWKEDKDRLEKKVKDLRRSINSVDKYFQRL